MRWPRLIFGCGYLGRRVAKAWQAQGHPVVALTRGNAETLHQLDIEPICGDVLDPPSLQKLPRASTVLYAVGLDRSAGHSMRDVYVRGLAHVLETLPKPERFIYISSTSVYGQTDGSWVDETSPTEPRESSGQVVLEAEQLVRCQHPDAIILRLAGIYGPHRLLRQQAIVRSEPLVGDAEKWLNLIHVDDAVQAVLVAEQNAQPGQFFNVADGTPVTRREFYTYLGLLLHSPARFEDHPEPGTANRRIDTTRLRALGWQPRYPSYREGLVQAVAESQVS
ncbi:MAG: SDR family oxidoreductase [Gemmataceae bacterium]|nr:SDR family oxidoreductase [Gemmata sp.]MDW8196429.1 SDR family oxidoreductase [Gemmataceae bacterium]